MTETDEQIKLARMGAFDDGAKQMEEQSRIARCICGSPSKDAEDHEMSCPIAVWGRAAKLLRTLKGAEDVPWWRDGEERRQI